MIELTLPLANIVVRERIRLDLGDVVPLADSISQVGLLHPPVVRRDEEQGEWVLVAGHRRLNALAHLGWEKTRVTIAPNVLDELRALRAEIEENTCRLALAPAELKRGMDRLLPKAKEAAKERQANGGRKAAPGRPDESSSPGDELRADEEVARALGTSKNTLRRIEEVYETAADEEAPTEVREVAQTIVEDWQQRDPEAPSPRAAAEAVAKAKKQAEQRRAAEDAAAVEADVTAVADELDPTGPERARRSAEIARLAKLRARASQSFVEMQPDVIADVSDEDELRAWRSFLIGLRRYGDKLELALGPNLKVVPS